jgi:heterodisulfide reductase subunit A
VCAKTCQAKAIDFEQKDTMVEINAGAIVMASGYDVFDPSVIPEYGYGRIPNVVTAIEFERLLSASGPTAGHLDRPSELALEKRIGESAKEVKKLSARLKQLEEKQGKTSEEVVAQTQSLAKLEAALGAMERKMAAATTAKKLAFIQCVGSRDFRFNRFCSSFCCMHSVKEAMIANEHDREVHSSIFCMDLRAVGRGFEEYKLRGGQQANIDYVRGRVAEITEDAAGNPVVWFESTTDRQVRGEVFDMVVLAAACVPSAGTARLAQLAGVELDSNGFVKTDPLMPLAATRPGIFVCGCAQGPMDIPESVAQASSAAACAAEAVIGANVTLRASAL